MSIRSKIEEKYIKAIKAKNLEETNTYRLIKSAIKDKDIESRSDSSKEGIEDQKILALLQSLIKQRKDSIESFQTAGRDDLIKKEKLEIDLINQFLPEQLNQDETEKLIKELISEKNLSSIKQMGLLMNHLKLNHSGNIDMALAGKIAKNLLNK
tara:strand:+ start:799 stop:1260 length:462 start_codon:yes stop_codon:yes gene_type:complete